MSLSCLFFKFYNLSHLHPDDITFLEIKLPDVLDYISFNPRPRELVLFQSLEPHQVADNTSRGGDMG